MCNRKPIGARIPLDGYFLGDKGIYVQKMAELPQVAVYDNHLQIDELLKVLNVFRDGFRYEDLQLLDGCTDTGALKVVERSLLRDNSVKCCVNPNILKGKVRNGISVNACL